MPAYQSGSKRLYCDQTIAGGLNALCAMPGARSMCGMPTTTHGLNVDALAEIERRTRAGRCAASGSLWIDGMLHSGEIEDGEFTWKLYFCDPLREQVVEIARRVYGYRE